MLRVLSTGWALGVKYMTPMDVDGMLNKVSKMPVRGYADPKFTKNPR